MDQRSILPADQEVHLCVYKIRVRRYLLLPCSAPICCSTWLTIVGEWEALNREQARYLHKPENQFELNVGQDVDIPAR